MFDELTALDLLNLAGNSLTALPDDVFEPLTSLTYLALSNNPGAPFSPTAVALPDDGTVPPAGGTVMLDGSGSGGAWGTNVTYAWALTTPTTGVTVTFDNDSIAEPTVTIPQVTDGHRPCLHPHGVTVTAEPTVTIPHGDGGDLHLSPSPGDRRRRASPPAPTPPR